MYGETVKRARKGKGMTLKEACGDALSISQLSRFENGKSVIPVDLFYKVLNNINTTPEEFFYFMGQEEEVRLSRRFNLIAKHVKNDKYDQLRKLKTAMTKEHPSPYSWDQFLIYFIDSLIELKEKKTAKPQEHILHYLMQVENWGEMELRLYALFGFVLEVETMHHLMHTALKRSKLYQHIPQDQKLLYTILSNCFSTFLFNNRLDYAEETITLFDKVYSENVDAISPHIDFMFNKGLLHLKRGELDEGKENCIRAIELCKTFRQKEGELFYRERYKSWLEGVFEPDYRELMIKVDFFSYSESHAKE